jgi:hypothetical protein
MKGVVGRDRLRELPRKTSEEDGNENTEEMSVLRTHQGIGFLQNCAAQSETGRSREEHDKNALEVMTRFCRC